LQVLRPVAQTYLAGLPVLKLQAAEDDQPGRAPYLLPLAADIHTQFARWMRAQPASQTLSGTALHPLSKQLLYPHLSSPAYRRVVWVRTCGSTWMARPQGPSPRGAGTRPGNAWPASLESAMTFSTRVGND